jgi:dCTP deaminase
MVMPFDEELLNPASLDVTLGGRIMVEVPETPELQVVDILGHTAEDPF